MHILAATVLFALPCPLPAAQHPAPHFHPGEWEIDSANTVMGGRTISSQTRICARHQMDFWKVAQAGLTCKPPKTRLAANGVRVRVHCIYNEGPLHSEIRSNVLENFTNNGNSFTLSGTTTTNTVYQGVQPKLTTAQLQTTAHRIGNCP
jgi:hypothetical protein